MEVEVAGDGAAGALPYFPPSDHSIWNSLNTHTSTIYSQGKCPISVKSDCDSHHFRPLLIVLVPEVEVQAGED